METTLTPQQYFLNFLWDFAFKKVFLLSFGILFFSTEIFSVSNCEQVEKNAQHLIFTNKEYQAADLIESCLSAVKENSQLYQFLGRHYHRRKRFATSVKYYNHYFKHHKGTFTEQMIFVHSLFLGEHPQEIKNFIKEKFPQPPQMFSCEKHAHHFDEMYLCYMKSFREYGIARKQFEIFLSKLTLKNKVEKNNIVFWYEIYVALFPDKRSRQILAMRLYQLGELKKSLQVYRFLQKSYNDQSTNYMIGQILMEMGKGENNLIDQE